MKAALITGGSRGIGRALVEEFAAAGYSTGFTYASNREAADALVERLRGEGRMVAAYQADARDFSRACEVVEQAKSELGPLNTLINNAGIKQDGSFHKMTATQW